MSINDSKHKINLVFQILNSLYDADFCFLECKRDYHMLLAVILTPRTTDKKTNEVLKVLFANYKTYKEIAEAPILLLEEMLKPLGFYKKKAVYLKEAASYLVQNQGVVPSDIIELQKIKGVGRKCASAILHYVYKIPAIIVDTHFTRVNLRLGFASGDAYKIEKGIASILDKQLWGSYSTLANIHAREVCKTRPNCKVCKIKEYCKYFMEAD